jgi:hypothetical protein
MKWNLNRDGQQFHQYQQNVQSPLTLTHWRQKEEDIWRWKCMFFFFWPLICLSFDWRFLTTFWPLICLSFFDGFWLPFDHWSVCLSLTDSDYLLTIDLSVFLWRFLTTSNLSYSDSAIFSFTTFFAQQTVHLLLSRAFTLRNGHLSLNLSDRNTEEF